MIKVKFMGGLGNQMFQYALAKHLAIKNKTEVLFDTTFLKHRLPGTKFVFRNYDLDIFSNVKEKESLLSTLASYLNNTAYVIQTLINKVMMRINSKYYVIERKQYEFETRVMESPKNSYLMGYWQNEKYFKDIKDVVRNDFSKFRYPMSEKALKLLEEIKKTNSVCVNFRRTDYLAINTFVGDTDANYYDNAIKLLSEKTPDIHLFIFSDDIEWCKDNFKSQFPVTFVDHSYAGKKFSDYFQLMINCKHYIIPNSTFAWWAAWLNPSPNKIVIAPKIWIDTNQFDSSDMVPPEWIRV